MTASEKEYFEAVPANEFNTYWVPCTWFVFRLQEATKKGKLLNQYALENIMRVNLFNLCLYRFLKKFLILSRQKWANKGDKFFCDFWMN